MKTIFHILRLAGLFIWQACEGSIRVAYLALKPGAVTRSALVRVPVRTRSDHGLWLLACLITLTTGTVSIDTSEDGEQLLIHSMLSSSVPELVSSIQNGFDKSVAEVFG